MRRSTMYGFPAFTLDPGEERSATIEVTGAFRAQKILMHGVMDEIRGHFRLKRSGLPLLNRDDVVAYTRIYRCRRGERVWFRPGKTTVEFSGFDGGVREYLASSVEYIRVDPLEYIQLRNLFIGKEPAMPTLGGGAPAAWFGQGQYGNGLPLPTAEQSMTMILANDKGDIQVRVYASVMGIGLA